MFLFNNIDFGDPLINVLIGTLFLLLIGLTILGIIQFILFIYYFFVKSTNSLNLQGHQMIKFYIKKYGFNLRFRQKGISDPDKNLKIESVWLFFLDRFKLDEVKKIMTLRIMPWTYHRTSLHTMAGALEEAWFLSSIKSNRYLSWWWEWSRKITLFTIISPFIFLFIYLFNQKGNLQNFGNLEIIMMFIFSILFLAVSITQTRFYYHCRKEIIYNLEKDKIFLPEEITAIKRILTARYIYWFLRTIYEVLELILRIVILFSRTQRRR